jgi:hypothetical protein
VILLTAKAGRFMGWHFRLLALLFVGYAGLCGWFVKRYPDGPYGESFAGEYAMRREQDFLWAALICATGAFGSLAVIVRAHAPPRRQRWWLVAAASVGYLVVCGSGLGTLLYYDYTPGSRNTAQQAPYFAYFQFVCGLLYLALLALIHGATAAERSTADRTYESD